jgi:hypothetical protein
MVGNLLQRMELWVCESRVRKPPRQSMRMANRCVFRHHSVD